MKSLSVLFSNEENFLDFRKFEKNKFKENKLYDANRLFFTKSLLSRNFVNYPLFRDSFWSNKRERDFCEVRESFDESICYVHNNDMFLDRIETWWWWWYKKWFVIKWGWVNRNIRTYGKWKYKTMLCLLVCFKKQWPFFVWQHNICVY